MNLSRDLQMSQEESQQLQDERSKLMADVQADAATPHPNGAGKTMFLLFFSGKLGRKCVGSIQIRISFISVGL